MAVSSAAIQEEWTAVRSSVETRLDELLVESPGDPLNRSIRHSLLTPGKRLRPMMLVLTATGLGAPLEAGLNPACALEMVHTASLIVDDLPVMDDATLRRGRRTAHSRFGVEIAILAAVSLLNRAPAVIASCEALSPALRLQLVELLSLATGDVRGLAAGQIEDLQAKPEETSLADLERIVRHKTCSLFVWAAESGARIAGASDETICGMNRFATEFGLAFQALDDLADVNEPGDELQEDAGQDGRKATYATLLGAEEALAVAGRHAERAQVELAELGLADGALARLADLALTAPTG